MQIASEYRIRRILDEVGRGSSLENALGLIAEAVVAESGVPVCKVWVVKRGDICDHCPLAEACANRQMCLHLVAACGAEVEKEYPRIPLSALNASLISRGGVSDFSDPRGAGDKLFGLQRSHNKETLDTYALYPLRGLNGTVGMIGLFHHRPFHQDELRALEELAPAAVAAIRVAELQSRCDSLRARLDRESASAGTVQEAAQQRATELEDAVAQLTRMVGQLQVERETLWRDNETSARRLAELQEQNQQLREHAAALEADRQRGAEAAAELATLGDSARRLEEENARLKERATELAASVAEFNQSRDALGELLAERDREIELLQTKLATAVQLDGEHAQLREQFAALEERYDRVCKEQQATADGILELERTLRLAEDARERHEQQRSQLAARAAELESELDDLRAERLRLRDENARLKVELEQLRAEQSQASDDIYQENTRLRLLADELAEKQANAAARAAELEKRLEAFNEELEQERASGGQRIAELQQANAALDEQLRAAANDREALIKLQQQHMALNDSHAQLEARITEFALEASQLRPRAVELETQLERMRARSAELEAEIARLNARGLDLEQENAAMAQVNQELQGAIERFESVAAQLEENVAALRTRAEASERARADLEQRNRMLAEQNRRLHSETHTRARLLANMSHELRTPMNAIIGFTSLLLDDRALQLQERHRGNLERVARNARNLLELINNVLDLSKIEAGRMEVYVEPADVRDLIERAVAIVEPLKENRPVQLNISVEENLPTLKTDRTKLQQALINLLSNALKFTAAGEVGVRAERADDERVRIRVSDTGVGISESDLPKIFDEFRQVGRAAHSAHSGTGLGLAITSRLVELLSGTIEVSSRVGEGSVFTITLPLEIEGRALTADGEAPLTDPERTALVVAGDPASLYLLKKYLGEAGYSVAATDDGGRGVEIARLAQPVIVVVDLDQLENGIAMLETIARDNAERTEQSRAIVAVAASAGLEAAARQAGATVFLTKPLERAPLIAAVERAEQSRPGRVLVVEDDDDALALVEAILEESGYEVETARDGRAALEFISQNRPDAIILDLMLPEMDGFEVVHRLHVNADWRDTPVILLTARDLSHEERRALDTGTTRVIQKGNFTRDELLAELRQMIGERRASAAS
ncbi:MAG TPA: response regulator [Blastocatellia bacterium]|nr:response regulator [Blastocatellia bacterium]